jgi:GNAT superfamily N-acetyltransferase
MDIDLRLLQRGDEDVVGALRTYAGGGDPEGLLADPRTFMLVAFDNERPVGFVLAHELPRRHGDRSKLFVYEVDVAESQQRRGIGKALLARLAEIARSGAFGSASSSPSRTTTPPTRCTRARVARAIRM